MQLAHFMQRASHCLALLFLLLLAAHPLHAQRFDYYDMDIGRLHHSYSEIGALPEASRGMYWPAEMAGSSSMRNEGFWLGVKDWTSPDSALLDYAIMRVGPRISAEETLPILPISSRLVSKWKRTEVTVNGIPNPDSENLNETYEIDPSLPADQMIHHVYRTELGADVERKVYGYVNQFHDDYHVIERTITNTGNIDADEEIELPNQTLNELMVFNIWRWTGREELSYSGMIEQRWGKFNMIDIVGDGNEEYDVDFTAIYSWAGNTFVTPYEWNLLGGPALLETNTTFPDTSGRLTGMSMQGLVVLHADAGPSDNTYNPLVQPRTLGWIDTDEPLNAGGQPARDYYELGILTRENPDVVSGGSSRMYPHYADRILPDGDFDTSTMDASNGKAGGHASTVAYGPYQLGPGEDIRIVEALASNGLSLEAATFVGEAYKASELDDNLLIEYDANNDGMINQVSIDFSQYNGGSEAQTKNQWFLSSKDSLFMSMERAGALWAASNEMTEYPIVEAPAPPSSFSVSSFPDRIELSWELQEGGPSIDAWEIYRTDSLFTNAPYERIAVLGSGDRTYTDITVSPLTEYYYYIQAVGMAQAADPNAISGTPRGVPVRSSRYLAQTKVPAVLFEAIEIPDFIEVLETDELILEDAFGAQVSLSGDYAAISAPLDDSLGFNNGAVYVYERQADGSWNEDARTTIPTPDVLGRPDLRREFGDRLLLTENQLFLRDRQDDDATRDGGAIYEYRRNEAGDWVQANKILAGPDVQYLGNLIGHRLAFDGNTLLATSVRNAETVNRRGAVYAFEQQDDSTWVQAHEFVLDWEDGTVNLGHSIALDLPYAFICAEAIGSETEEFVFVFEQLEDGTWVQRQILSSGNPAGELFAFDMAVVGNQLLAGAPLATPESTDGDVLDGAVYVYEQQPSDSSWVLQQVLKVPTEFGERGNFGGTIAAEDDRAVILAGEVVALFERDAAGTWTLTRTLRNLGGYSREFRAFGAALDISGDFALVGAPATFDAFEGSSYVFDLTRITYTFTEKPNDATDEIPSAFTLAQNYPNPFNPVTTITYELPEASEVRITVYNALGKRVRTLVDKVHTAGQYEVVFDATNLGSGAYFYRLETPTRQLTRTMMLLK